jgi:hypothetical protein
LVKSRAIDSIIDIGAAFSPYVACTYQSDVKLICVDDHGLPNSSNKICSVQGFVGPNHLDVNSLFEIFNGNSVFLKIDTDDLQLSILKQISTDNWSRVSIVQFESDFWNQTTEMAELVMNMLSTKVAYQIQFNGIYEISTEKINDGLYKNVAVMRPTHFFATEQRSSVLSEFQKWERIELNANFYKALRKSASHEIARGFTEKRRSMLGLPLDTFSPSLNLKKQNIALRICISAILFFHQNFKKLGRSLYHYLKETKKY